MLTFESLTAHARRKAARAEQSLADREIKPCAAPFQCGGGGYMCDACYEKESIVDARENIALKKIKSLGYAIEYNPPPIPMRCCDWQYAHEDFDGAPDANDPRCGTGPDPESCLAAIEDLEEELRGEE